MDSGMDASHRVIVETVANGRWPRAIEVPISTVAHYHRDTINNQR